MRDFIGFLSRIRLNAPDLVDVIISAHSVCFESRDYDSYHAKYLWDNLHKYIDSAGSYFIRFSDSWHDSKGQRVNKVGVRTGNRADDPRGIYAYWANHMDDVTYRDNCDTAYVLRLNRVGNQIIDISSISPDEYVHYMDILANYLISKKENVPTFGVIDSHTKFSEYITFIKYQFTHTPRNGSVLWHAVQSLDAGNGADGVYHTYIWLKVLGITFIGDHGGIIYNGNKGEYHQGVFFDPKAYTVIDKFDNIRKVDHETRDADDGPHSINHYRIFKTAIDTDDELAVKSLLAQGRLPTKHQIATTLMHQKLNIFKLIFDAHPSFILDKSGAVRPYLYNYMMRCISTHVDLLYYMIDHGLDASSLDFIDLIELIVQHNGALYHTLEKIIGLIPHNITLPDYVVKYIMRNPDKHELYKLLTSHGVKISNASLGNCMCNNLINIDDLVKFSDSEADILNILTNAVDYKYVVGYRELMYAIKLDYSNLVKYILSQPDIRDDYPLEYILNKATKYGSTKIINLIADYSG